MSAIELMLAEDERRRRSAIKTLQASIWDGRPGDVWTPREELLRDAVLELWATLTLLIEIEKMREGRIPRWRKIVRRWFG